MKLVLLPLLFAAALLGQSPAGQSLRSVNESPVSYSDADLNVNSHCVVAGFIGHSYDLSRSAIQ